MLVKPPTMSCSTYMQPYLLQTSRSKSLQPSEATRCSTMSLCNRVQLFPGCSHSLFVALEVGTRILACIKN